MSEEEVTTETIPVPAVVPPLYNTQTGEIVDAVQIRHKLNQEQKALIKRMYSKDASDTELELLFYQSERTGLDVLAKQLYLIKRKGVAAIQTGIDGYRVVADRTGKYAGSDEANYTYDKNNNLRSASVTVWKMICGQRCPFTQEVLWDEYHQTNREGRLTATWQKMPHVMLAKCAESGALRKAFPNDLSGIYTSEEMGQADNQLPAPTRSGGRPDYARKGGRRDAPVDSEPSHTPDSSGDGSDVDSLKSMGSKYGSQEKPNKCNFCNSYHIVQGDTVVLHPTTEKWGSRECYIKQTQGSDEGGKEAPNNNENDDVEGSIRRRVAGYMQLGDQELLKKVHAAQYGAFPGGPGEIDLPSRDEYLAKLVDGGAISGVEYRNMNNGELARLVVQYEDIYKNRAK